MAPRAQPDRLPGIDGATVFAELAGDVIKGIVVEVAVEAHDEAAASKQGRAAIRSELRRVGVSRWELHLVDGHTSVAPPSAESESPPSRRLNSSNVR